MALINKGKGRYLRLYLLAIGIALFILTLYIGYKVYTAEKILIPVSVIALLAGLIFEYRRISENWKTVLLTALFSLIMSFFIFFPANDSSSYDFDGNIEMWPYVFCFFFILAVIVTSGSKIIPKLTEGITLLQSIAVIYWALDLGFLNINNGLELFLMFISSGFALFSIWNAFSYITLSKSSRFILSIWSSFIMILFSIDNIYQVYQSSQIETRHNVLETIYIALQFFLLGVSSIYIIENFIMLIGFFPSKKEFFNAAYRIRIAKLKEEHIDRYSTGQVTRLDSLLSVLLAGIIFGLNYYYRFLPRNFLIWTFFVLFPIVINFINKSRASGQKAWQSIMGKEEENG